MKFSLISDPAFDAGLGHLSRLVALGQELRDRGESYCFHPLGDFPSRHLEFILGNLLSIECSCKGKPDITIIDTYNADFINGMVNSGSGIVIQLMDEITPQGRCNGFIEVSPIPQFVEYLDTTAVLKFGDSPLFRDEIYSLKAEIEPQNLTENEGVLILGGVSDSVYFETLKVLKQSLGEKIQGLTVATSSKAVVEIAREMGVGRSSSLQEMTFIAGNFSYVISGAGVTAWELAFLRIPGFVISLVENQEFQLRHLIDNGYRNGVSLSSKNVTADVFECMRAIREMPLKIPGGGGRQKILDFLGSLSH